MGSNFDELVGRLAEYDLVIDAAYLHGLLTGYATIPKMNTGKLFEAVAGQRPLAEVVSAAVLDNINLIAESLTAHEFEARFDSHRSADAKQWLEGYFRAVEIHEQDWQELNESRIKAAGSLMALHTMADAGLHGSLNMNLPGPGDLKRDPQLVTDLVSKIYDEFHGHAGSAPPPDEFIPGADLSVLDEASLMIVLTSSDDALPFEFVTECARRADAMVPLLRQHLENDAHWDEEVESGDWWALLHAVFILGLIPGEASAQSLLYAFRRITLGPDNDLDDWTSGYWPALCRNKREFTTALFRQIAQDSSVGWYARVEAIACVLADVAEQGSPALEGAIDWLAAMCGNATEDPEFRVIAGNSLLDFPRQRHRPVMEALVDLQIPGSIVFNSYTLADVQGSFDSGDSPEWHRFDNPWKFYDPEKIERRQERWLTESPDVPSGLYDPVESAYREPYLREEPKVGRNDPCPCGSGKKYKKCCLNARP